MKQSMLKEINPEYSLEGLLLKLKPQHCGRLMWRADSLEKTLMLERLRAGGEGGDRGWDGWIASPTQWIWVWPSSRRQRGQGSLACCSPWRRRVGHDLATEQEQQSLNENKIETITVYYFKLEDVMTHFRTGNWTWFCFSVERSRYYWIFVFPSLWLGKFARTFVPTCLYLQNWI